MMFKVCQVCWKLDQVCHTRVHPHVHILHTHHTAHTTHAPHARIPHAHHTRTLTHTTHAPQAHTHTARTFTQTTQAHLTSAPHAHTRTPHVHTRTPHAHTHAHHTQAHLTHVHTRTHRTHTCVHSRFLRSRSCSTCGVRTPPRCPAQGAEDDHHQTPDTRFCTRCLIPQCGRNFHLKAQKMVVAARVSGRRTPNAWRAGRRDSNAGSSK